MKAIARTARFTALPLVITLLAGCAVGPDYVSPAVDLPGHWSSDNGKRPQQAPMPLAQWWRRLDDPLLNQLIDEAVQGNLDVAGAKARIREARALLRQAIGGVFPQVSGIRFRHGKWRRLRQRWVERDRCDHLQSVPGRLRFDLGT